MTNRVRLDEAPIQYDLDFSNDGELLNSLNNILESIRQLSPVMLVVYIHGWRHVRENEHKQGSDKSAFTEALKRVQVAFAAREDKELVPVGIYIRWRARHLPEPFELFCYWLTRNRADKILNRGILASTLETLSKLTKEFNDESEIVLIGHSMGARILGQSLLKTPDLLSESNLVLLVNSADDYRTASKIQDVAVLRNSEQGSNEENFCLAKPSIVWLTARFDLATRLIFPIAEWKWAVGHVKILRTHEIRKSSKKFESARLAFTFRAIRWIISPTQQSSEMMAWWNVWVPGNVILGHNDPKERFKQILQSIYHLIYDRPRLERYFELLASSNEQASMIARHQIVYQYDNEKLKNQLLSERIKRWEELSEIERQNCRWIQIRMSQQNAVVVGDEPISKSSS